MENTQYWSKKKLFFASKCQDQTDGLDGRVLRKYIHPRNKTEESVWEYQRDSFSGLVESFWIRDGEYGKELLLGLQNETNVNVLQFKVTDQKGNLSKDFVSIAKKIKNIDFNKELIVEIWENHRASEKREDGTIFVPVYLLFKRDVGERFPKSYPSYFEYDEDLKVYKGLPAVEKTEGFDGKPRYDTSARDRFLYELVEEVLKANESIFEANKNTRPLTPSEQSVQATLAGSPDIEEDVPF